MTSILKLAEQHANNGVPKGDSIYLRLLTDVDVLTEQYCKQYGQFDIRKEIPAYRDLELLATEDKVIPWYLKAAGILVGSAGLAMASGVFASFFTIGYHILLNWR
ncbi:MAG: hypothetical protein WA766_03110 [Candidatus Acidiferrales bacterium]